MFNFARVLIHHITIGIQKVMEVHIEIIGNKMRIQSRPGNPYLFTAPTTSLAVEVHDEHNLFRQQNNVGMKKATLNLLWMAFGTS